MLKNLASQQLIRNFDESNGFKAEGLKTEVIRALKKEANSKEKADGKNASIAKNMNEIGCCGDFSICVIQI